MVNIKILKNIIIGALLMQFQVAATQSSVMETKGNDEDKISLKVLSFLSGDEEKLNLQASPQRTILDVKKMIAKHTDINGYETFLPDDHNVALETVYWMEVSVKKLH